MIASTIEESNRIPGQPWTFQEAAEFLHLSVKTLERAEDNGRLKVIRFGRRKAIADVEVRRVAVEGFAVVR